MFFAHVRYSYIFRFTFILWRLVNVQSLLSSLMMQITVQFIFVCTAYTFAHTASEWENENQAKQNRTKPNPWHSYIPHLHGLIHIWPEFVCLRLISSFSSTSLNVDVRQCCQFLHCVFSFFLFRFPSHFYSLFAHFIFSLCEIFLFLLWTHWLMWMNIKRTRMCCVCGNVALHQHIGTFEKCVTKYCSLEVNDGYNIGRNYWRVWKRRIHIGRRTLLTFSFIFVGIVFPFWVKRTHFILFIPFSFVESIILQWHERSKIGIRMEHIMVQIFRRNSVHATAFALTVRVHSATEGSVSFTNQKRKKKQSRFDANTITQTLLARNK